MDHRRFGVRLALALTTVFAVGAFAGVAAANHGWTCYYCGPAWFTSGEFHDSWYDCSPSQIPWWNEQWMWKSDTALGTIAWIDPQGNWPVARTTYEINMVYGISPHDWSKKLYGKNSSSVGYSAELRGHTYVNVNCI